MSKKIVALQVLTASRLVFALIFLFLEFQFHFISTHLVYAVLLLTLIEVSDILDGYLARKFKLVSEFGKVFDPFADSTSRLLIYYSISMHGYVWTIVPLIMALRDITVSYSRIVLVQNGQDTSARFSGKLKAVVQGTGAFVSIILPAWFVSVSHLTPSIVSVVVICATVYSSIHYVRDAVNSIES